MGEINASERLGNPTFRSLTDIFQSTHARQNVLAWTMLLAVALVDCIWMKRAGFEISSASVMHNAPYPILLAGTMLILHYMASRPRYSAIAAQLRIRDICTIAHALLLISVFAYASLILQYLCVALARPLIDGELVAIDAALGFHWPDLYSWQIRHPVSSSVLVAIYLSYPVQVVLTAVAIGLAGRADDLAGFVLLFMIIALITILISAPLPASNPMVHFGILGPHDSPWSNFDALRDGSMNVFDLDNNQGLISLPSLHAADAALFAYAVRRIRWLFPISVVWNVAMVYSAIPFGAHYLIDIVAGLALSGALFAIARKLKRRIMPSS